MDEGVDERHARLLGSSRDGRGQKGRRKRPATRLKEQPLFTWGYKPRPMFYSLFSTLAVAEIIPIAPKPGSFRLCDSVLVGSVFNVPTIVNGLGLISQTGVRPFPFFVLFFIFYWIGSY